MSHTHNQYKRAKGEEKGKRNLEKTMNQIQKVDQEDI